MPPIIDSVAPRVPKDPLSSNNSREQIIVEAWAQGFNVGALVVITLIVLCNYRKGILLHKLILLELILAWWHGFFIFFRDPVYGWVLGGTATPLYISYNLHNVVAWVKIKPFLPRWGGLFFIISLIAIQPYWVVEAFANFAYFNDVTSMRAMFKTTRYLEAPMRDPWWIFTTIKLVLVINKNYDYTMVSLVRTSPRFGVMLLCMFVSVVFLITDIIATALVSAQSGINPFWRLALVFKCASDAIFLDDFKSVLDRIAESALKYVANLPNSSAGDGDPGNNPGRRRGSSVGGFRHANAGPHRFKSHQPRHVVHISADRGPNNEDFKSAATESVDSSSRQTSGASTYWTQGDFDGAHGQQGIRAHTTITISGNGESRQNSILDATSSRGRSGSQERILPASMGTSTTTPHDYGWGEPPRRPPRPDSLETGIPMIPIRARTNGRL